MARIICLDYGLKRTGIAVTDPLQIIATAHSTIDSKTLLDFLKKYMLAEQVELLLIGMPLNLDDTPTHGTPLVEAAIKKIKKAFPNLPLQTVDERYSSKNASKAMVQMGMKKKDRQVKANIDVVSATMLLQEYLANR
jgi:putative holliday junction resolvase